MPQYWEISDQTSAGKFCTGVSLTPKKIGVWLMSRQTEVWDQVARGMGAPIQDGQSSAVVDLTGRWDLGAWFKNPDYIGDQRQELQLYGAHRHGSRVGRSVEASGAGAAGHDYYTSPSTAPAPAASGPSPPP